MAWQWFDAYPSWLGWTGIVIGATNASTATSLYVVPDVVPGALLYGLLASIIAQMWMVTLGVVMLRNAVRLSRKPTDRD